ncbi:MAG TPA: SRPBCC family protein [Microlunatus sp.]|nr:SRPBCC family protein [Microlunatus sp.]
MAVVNVEVRSPLSPEEVLRVITDFSERRAEAWPGVDLARLVVHEVGENFADVTEGNDTTWERERYEWDSAAGTVTAKTLESNVWAEGSRWDYRITPVEGGSLVGVRLERYGKNVKGKLIGALLPVVGKKVITGSLASALKLS